MEENKSSDNIEIISNEPENIESSITTTQTTQINDKIASSQIDDNKDILNELSNINIKFDEGDSLNPTQIKEIDSSSGASSSNSSFDANELKPNNCSNNKNSKSAQVMNLTNNSSLCNLLVYNSETDDSEPDSVESDSYECESDLPEVVVIEKPIGLPKNNKKKKNPSLLDTLKTLGELSIDDLPPVPNIASMGVRSEDCDEIGKISSIIDRLVMVESIPNKPAYDIDTLLFLDSGKQPLGYIFDVIGSVTCPMYAIRFNSTKEIAALNIVKGMPVFSAPKSEHTQYVFVQQLLKEKGTDASWTDDMEAPQEAQEFSDDETEGAHRSGINPDTRKRNSIERYRNFEKDMNVKNLIDTRLHKIRDNFEPTNKKHTPNNNYKRGYHFQPNYRPQYGFSQNMAANNAASCAFVSPPFSMPAFMAANMPPFAPQNVATFVPTMPPPAFVSRLPPPPQMTHFGPYHPHDMVFPPLPPMPNTSKQGQGPSPHMSIMYPPDMGLPRPPSQTPNFVPNMPFYDPRLRMYFPNNTHPPPPQHTNRQPPVPKPRHYFPKRQ